MTKTIWSCSKRGTGGISRLLTVLHCAAAVTGLPIGIGKRESTVERAGIGFARRDRPIGKCALPVITPTRPPFPPERLPRAPIRFIPSPNRHIWKGLIEYQRPGTPATRL